MTATLLGSIGLLVTNDPTVGDGSPLGKIVDAALVMEAGRILWAGPAGDAPATDLRLDAAGCCVIPGFVDSHAHLMFAGDRSTEFAARMAGSPYTAGGILTTVGATRAATDEKLAANAAHLVGEMQRQGTTTVEIKSGYGLTVRDEARALALARDFTTETTFLGAHIVPPEYTNHADDYVDLLKGVMLEAAAPFAKWIDAFCERGAFDVDQSRAILSAGLARGLRPRLHANQLGPGPGVQLACAIGAASADHCTYLTDDDVTALATSNTVATLLPAVEFSTRSPYPNARRLLDAGVTVALATDCNPGTSYTTSMPFCIALAVREMRMTPEEALWAATAGGAAALQRTDVGRLSPGARADIAMLNAPSYVHLAYRPGVPIVSAVWKDSRRC